MEKYSDIRDRLTKIQFIINDKKDIIYQNYVTDSIDLQIFETVIEKYDRISYLVAELKQLIEKTLLCKSDIERLDFFLNNIYSPEQVAEDEII